MHTIFITSLAQLCAMVVSFTSSNLGFRRILRAAISRSHPALMFLQRARSLATPMPHAQASDCDARRSRRLSLQEDSLCANRKFTDRCISLLGAARYLRQASLSRSWQIMAIRACAIVLIKLQLRFIPKRICKARLCIRHQRLSMRLGCERVTNT